MEIKQETREGWHIMTVAGRADAITSDALETALVSALQNHQKLALDLSALDYVSSAGLRSLLQGIRAAQKCGAEFVICSPKPNVKSVFDISGFPQIVRIEGALPC